MKECPKCNENKSKDLFYKNKTKKDGLSPICKKCQSVYDDKQYKKNHEKYKITSTKTRYNKVKWFNSLKDGKICKK